MLAADSIQLLFACVVLRHKGYHLFRLRDIQPQLVKQAISYGFRAHLSNILAFLNYRLDMFILGAMTNPAAVGIYTVSVRVAEQLWIFSSAISSVLLPHIAGMEDEEARRSMTSLVSRNVLWLSVVAALAVWGLSFVLVDALFGQAYHQAAAVLRILLPGIAVGGMARILSNHLAGIGRPQINMYFAMGTVSMNVVLNILLISRLGVAGAALATTITYGANALGKVLFFWLVLRFPLRGFLLLGKEDAALYRRLLARVGRRGGKENLL